MKRFVRVPVELSRREASLEGKGQDDKRLIYSPSPLPPGKRNKKTPLSLFGRGAGGEGSQGIKRSEYLNRLKGSGCLHSRVQLGSSTLTA